MQFKIGSKGLLYRGSYIKLFATSFDDKSGEPQKWEWIEKADVVCALPITDDGNILLVKNYRVPVERYVIELPAGMLDKFGESPKEAMERELLEEVGYQAATWHALPPYPYRAGTSKNIVHCFIATGLTKIADASGDETEDLFAMQVPANQLLDLWLHPPEDTYFHPEIFAAYQAAMHLGLLAG